jgi:hypothetical protein
MYCSSCGVAVAQGLSYCNYCGAKLSGEASDNFTITTTTEIKPELLVSAMVAVFVLGLGAITGLMAVMKGVLDLNGGQILAFTLLSFLTMLALEGVFLRLLLRRQRGAEESRTTEVLNAQTAKELDAAPERLPMAMPSVTEHTTRAFAPIYDERNSK